MISLLGSNVSILHKVHIKNCQRITLIKEIQYLESIVRLLKKFNFTKQISAFSFFLSLKADIFLYFGETNTVIKLSRNPKQKYCYFKDSSSPLRFSLRREQQASLLRSDLSRVPMPHCHIIHCLVTRDSDSRREMFCRWYSFHFPHPHVSTLINFIVKHNAVTFLNKNFIKHNSFVPLSATNYSH